MKAPVVCLIVALSSALAGWGHTAPVFTNLTASQRTGTKLVDIAYDVAAPGFEAVTVSLEISSDSGATWTVPTISATGHVGAGVAPGTGKAIIWNAGVDWAGNYSTQMQIRVLADNGFALIPGGSFTMGVTSGDTESDAPPVTVTVGTFYLAETETTKAQWDTVRTWALAYSSPYTDLAAGAGKAADHPVQSLSWWDVVKWCNARSEMEGLTPVYTVGGAVMRTGMTVPDVNWSANGYRLPTEAEWEKAARGGVSGKRFPWGTDMISHAEANFGNAGWETYQTGTTGFHPTYATGEVPYTSPVGSFAANGFGLKEMAGNVWEWCWDWYAAGTYAGGAADPRGPASGLFRVYRGGGWDGYAGGARCSYRNADTPSFMNDGIGLRAARSSVPDSAIGSATTDNVTVDSLDAVRPDVAVGSSVVALTGVGLHSPASQVASLVSKKAKAVTGYASIANRSDRPDVIAGRASGGNAFFAVAYSGPEGNITAGLLAGTYRTPEMEQGDAPVSIRATITPNKKKLTKKKGKKTIILKKTHTLLIQVNSTFDAAISDAALIRVQTK